jgi:hypothetical protein
MPAIQAIETSDPVRPDFPSVLRWAAEAVSVAFHPLFIPVIGAWLVIQLHPMQFVVFDHKMIFRLYASVISNMVILTGFTVLVLKLVHFIDSIRLPTQRDRVIPYVATMTFYFWEFLVMKHRAQIPPELTAFILGCFIAVVFAFISNIRIKISMHALGMGGLTGLVFCFFGVPYFNIALLLAVIIILGGIVCTCRMILGEHTLREIYLGAMFGITAQIIASWMIS